MNFLDDLVSQWYSYQGYYVRTNVRVGPRALGGYEGELDVVAYKPDSNEVVHCETSMDALSWKKRRDRFQQKFERGKKYIPGLFNRQEMNIQQRAIFAYPRSTTLPNRLGSGIQIVLMPELIGQIINYFRKVRLGSAAVPENLPLIRAMQFAAQFGGIAPSRTQAATRWGTR